MTQVGEPSTAEAPAISTEILAQRWQRDILLRERSQIHSPTHGRMAEIGRRNRYVNSATCSP